jgi:iron complex transport system substrate-binding protein
LPHQQTKILNFEEILKMFHRLIVVPSLLVALLFVLAACSSEDDEAPAAQQPAPTQIAPAPFPVTVTDMLGRQVEISQKPERIVSISPTATEMLYRVRGVAIARDSSSKFPPETESLPTVGGAYTPSVEAIVGHQPDLILIEALTQGHMLPMLEPAGAQIIAVRATSVDDVAQALELLGTILNQPIEAEEAAQEIQARVNNAASALSSTGSVLILISDADRNLYAAKPESYPGAVATALNMTNVAAGLADSGPFPGFTLFSAEQAIASNPDFIFAISPAPEPAPRLSAVLPRVPGFTDLAAVKEGKLKEIDPGLFLQAPGPRIADAAEQMSGLIQETQ